MKLTQGRRILRILLLSLLLVNLLDGTRLCRDGSLYWEPHDRCYLIERRGPCSQGEILIEKPEGPLCIADYRSRVRTIKDHIRHRTGDNDIDTNLISKKSDFQFYRNGFNRARTYRLPSPYSMSHKERECLENFEVYWDPKGRCYPLLSSEPCEQTDQWLVLSSASGDIQVECKKKTCPCRDLDLCEVEVVSDELSCNKCIVSRAAAQRSVCKENEQLYIDPFGVGKCDCLRDPFHLKYEEKCYPLFSQGPCQEGHSLQYSKVLKTTTCSPEICPDTSILHDNGHCYFLGTKGPCRNGEYFDVIPESKATGCRKYENKRQAHREASQRMSPKKRVFDIIPKGHKPSGCVVDSRGTCRDIIDFDVSRIGKRERSRGIHFPGVSHQPEVQLMLPIPESVKTAEDFLNWLNGTPQRYDFF